MSLRPAPRTPRAGSVLIIVTGLAAVLLVMTMAFLARMRSDGEESLLVVREAQARIMLHAALNYLQEGARLGWDDPATPAVEEAFGWTDVRDGGIGPRGAAGQRLWSDDAAFPGPGGRAARFAMHVLERPPFAIRPDRAPNPVRTDTDDRTRLARFARPDPQPVAATWAEFADPGPELRLPRLASVNLAWFRVWREPAEHHDGDGEPWYDTIDLRGHHAVFVIACGAGGTRGYRSAAEAAADPASPEELRDPQLFAQLRAYERVLWYRAEWSAAVGQSTFDYINFGDTWQIWPPGGNGMNNGGNGRETARNFLGTFAWIQRLDQEPPQW